MSKELIHRLAVLPQHHKFNCYQLFDVDHVGAVLNLSNECERVILWALKVDVDVVRLFAESLDRSFEVWSVKQVVATGSKYCVVLDRKLSVLIEIGVAEIFEERQCAE
ncbi:hypothetical protein AS590_23635 [Prescottella equi]|nr:hypothetical protein AS590_23635 [Prescottella equi]